MSCGCANCDGLGNVSIVGGRVVPGSVVAWGGHILWQDGNESISWHSDAEAKIKAALYANGNFSNVDAGKIAGWSQPYISIKVTPRVEYAYLGDIFNVIEGSIWAAGYRAQSLDFGVESVPAGTPTTPQIAQPGRAGGVEKSEQNHDFFSIDWDPCKWLPSLCYDSKNKDESALDKWANFLGVGTGAAIGIGIGATLIALAAIKRAF